MSLTVPEALPSPVFFTKESVQVYYSQVKETAKFYSLRLPYLAEFVRKCSLSEPLNKQPVSEFLEDVYFSNEFDWNKYDAMVWKLTQPMASNVSLLFDRIKTLFNNVLDQDLVSRYPEGYRMPVKLGFAHDFKRTLDLLEHEAKKRQSDDVLKLLMKLMEKIYVTGYECQLKQKPSDPSFLEFTIDTSNVETQFNRYKRALLVNSTKLEALANGKWPFGRPSSTGSSSSTRRSDWW